jgi:signal transduction histidine kinase
MGVSVAEYMNITDPDDPRLADYKRALAGEPTKIETDWMGLSYETQAEPFRDAKGEIAGILAVSWNVTERKKAERGLRLLAEASVTLAESLDYEETLRKVARLAVGPFADWCIVSVAEGDLFRPMASAHVDSSKEPLFAGLPAVSVSLVQQWTEWLKEQRSFLFADITPDMIAPGTSLPIPPPPAGVDVAAILRRLGMRSMVVVPLVARHQTLGALTFVRGTGDRPYQPDDLALAEDLARRCASAIDNATLYRTAQAAIDARDEFLSVASHELRTPLTSIQLRLESMEKAAREGRGVTLTGPTGSLGIVLRQFKRLSNLVEQLLDVSRIRRGALELELETVDLSQLLREVAARFEGDLARTGSSLSITAPVPAVGYWDRVRLEQVVTDLLSNAIKFARGTTIEAEVGLADSSAHLIVRDRGMGISIADQARIFERFERAASTRHFGGLGLGLYITRQIVEAHGGTVRLASSPGVGTTVTIELPRAGAPASVSTPSPP